MKRFFYASAAILMLAIAYHLGASTATAQTTKVIVAAANGPVGLFAFTASGDSYQAIQTGGGALTWTPRGNVFSGSPTPAPALH